MRAAVVVGILALLCSAADAKPKKKRHGAFADYIEATAPDDPPRPPPPPSVWIDDGRSQPAVIFVVDRTVRDLQPIKKLVASACGVLSPNAIVAVVAFDSEAQAYVRPTRAANSFRISNDIMRMETSSNGNACAGLKEAFEIAQAINASSKTVVLLTDGEVPQDGLAELLMDMVASRIRTSVVGTPGGEREVLTFMADAGGGKLFMLDDKPGDRPLFDELRALKRGTPTPRPRR